MKASFKVIVAVGLASTVVIRSASLAQPSTTTSSSGASPEPEEVLVLSPFEVTGRNGSRYEVDESTSAARVRTSIFDSPSTVSVLTSEFIHDTNTTNAIDALKYVAGVVESTQPVGGDRMALRGFQTDGQVTDGFLRAGPYNHLDMALVDRIDVVKGPNAILNPSGQPGGTVNYTSKKANFLTFSNFGLQLGQYDADKATFDIGRIVSNDAAIRVAGSATYATGYYLDKDHSWSMTPSATFRLGKQYKLTLQAIFQETRRTFVGGVPISQSASTLNSTNSLWSGVPADANIYDAANNPRNESGQHYQAFLTGRITDELSVRVAAHLLFGSHDAIQFTNTPAPVGGIAVAGNNNINPFTGLYTPNTVYGGAPTFTATASPAPDGMFNRSSFSSFFTEQQYDIQNDYVYEIKRDQFSGSLTGGYFLTRNTNDYRTNNYSLPAFSIYGPYVYTPYTDLGPSNQGFQKTSITQEYLVGNLTLLNKKLILSAGISNNRYLTYINSLTKKGINSTNTTKVFKSAGVVVEPIETVSFYYGYSQSAAVNVPDVGVITPPLQIGEQQEAGVRYKFLGGRGTATVDYFYVTQSNVQVPNPANLVFPAPVPPLPSLASDRVACGWEFSTSMEINKNLSAIANFATFKNRDTFGAPFRGTAERSGALWAYFQSNPHSSDPGFGIGVGISYLSKRPGDAQNGYAPASVLAGTPVLKQPTFYLPAYYRVDLTASYRFSRHLSVQAMVENLFDVDYLAGSLNRNSVVAGVPINVKGSVNYSF